MCTYHCGAFENQNIHPQSLLFLSMNRLEVFKMDLEKGNVVVCGVFFSSLATCSLILMFVVTQPISKLVKHLSRKSS